MKLDMVPVAFGRKDSTDRTMEEKKGLGLNRRLYRINTSRYRK